ncbi:hypothetical protein LCGC14_2947310 [marine sediment metagenome]|uniref:Nucleoside 2-deoxyribosyltransferase n=1 Tax=marine sediment metagenome TaxID=412755 RepID=A0A0F8ZP05_9ZZZZ
MKIYLIGSLRNDKVPALGNDLRDIGHGVFDDWFAAGPEADDCWKNYEQNRGHTYMEALDGLAASHVYDFDRKHLFESDVGILVLPAGRSGHLELGIFVGRGKKAYILLDDESDRWDVMYRFAKVCKTKEELFMELGEG